MAPAKDAIVGLRLLLVQALHLAFGRLGTLLQVLAALPPTPLAAVMAMRCVCNGHALSSKATS